ncbi:uncharacterized protein [Watersipora subatra]|uniref:uncharacterized protein n=1 Tax=Watersipora subatra TaxID=2589382 RepID=UPI00355C8C64
MDNFIVEELPELEVGGQLQLKQTGERRDIELKIVSAGNIVVNSNQHPVVPQPQQLLSFGAPPKSITLLKSLKPPSYPVSVCQQKGVTYLGMYNGTVSRIDGNYKLHNPFISTPRTVESISFHENKLYILSHSEPRTVNVYDLSGQLITTWQHPFHEWFSSMLTVTAGDVVIADPHNKRLIIYSLTGTTLHNVNCHLLSNAQVLLCTGHGDDVIIANSETNKVFRFNITTENVRLTFTHPDPTQGLVCYRDYILVAARNSISIYTLSYATGEKVSKMIDDGISTDSCCNRIYSLSVTGQTLVVPHQSGVAGKLLFYKLSEK